MVATRSSTARARRDSAPDAPLVHWHVCVALIVVVTVASKFGDALAPTLVDTRPLTLLALNANDLHLALTAGRTKVLPYFVVGVSRRLLEDPLFYFVGRFYPQRAETHLARYFPDVARAAERCRAWFRRFATLAVFVEPGAAVCLMAGASRMSPTWFTLVNVVGTVSRVGAVRAAGTVASGWTKAATEAATRFRTAATAATVVVAAAAVTPLLRRVYREAHASDGNARR